jgi:hypothetical protein
VLPEALFPLKLIPLTLQANAVGFVITNRPLLPAHATVVLDTPAPCSDTSLLITTFEAHANPPAGIRTTAPAEAASTAACTSAALPFVDMVPSPLGVYAHAELDAKNNIDAVPNITLKNLDFIEQIKIGIINTCFRSLYHVVLLALKRGCLLTGEDTVLSHFRLATVPGTDRYAPDLCRFT